MKTEWLPGKNGYEIPYWRRFTGAEAQVLIVSHGFGSSKQSPTAGMLLEGMPQHGIGVIAYDFPNHGESKAGPDGLLVENCIRDLASVEEFAAEQCPQAEILYFSSSFGGFINLQYLSFCSHRGTRSFLRSCAVNMPELFRDPTKEQVKELVRTGYATIEHEPPLVVSREFVGDILDRDLMQLYRPGRTEVEMVHGAADETIDPQAAQAFAQHFSIPLTMVPGAGHRLMDKGQPEYVFDLALKMFQRKASKPQK
ncbi:MAG: alpha/beta hydrolase [Anaerovoracaceae bacterium]|jgi:alpha-beta hydrolase superfamily lysophospholipase